MPLSITNPTKNWTVSELFEEEIKEIDHKFSEKKRKIALIIDSYVARYHLRKLDCIQFIFLPLNTTLITQPVNQRLIHYTKGKQRSLTVKNLTSRFEKNSRT